MWKRITISGCKGRSAVLRLRRVGVDRSTLSSTPSAHHPSCSPLLIGTRFNIKLNVPSLVRETQHWFSSYCANSESLAKNSRHEVLEINSMAVYNKRSRNTYLFAYKQDFCGSVRHETTEDYMLLNLERRVSTQLSVRFLGNDVKNSAPLSVLP